MSVPRRALITGIGGQDGWHLAQWLQGQGYEVFGTSRSPATGAGADPRVLAWDGLDGARFRALVEATRPHEIYNFAARASGAGMYDDAVAIGDLNGLSVARILEVVREAAPATRVLQASSSEVFGEPAQSPQSESTPRNPRSPYGAAKAYADSMVAIYRKRYGLFACSAILFNHESARRSTAFVSRKITRAAARIRLGLEQELLLGNLEARRDWGYAGDYVRAAWAMLQQDEPRDFVLATGTTHSVRELCELAFAHVGLDYRDYVQEASDVHRPAEAVQLVGDAAAARAQLGWRPQVGFRELISAMVEADLAAERAALELGSKG